MIAVDPLPEDKAREVVWQLLEGVSHLHNLSIVHLDLKVREGGQVCTASTSKHLVGQQLGG